MNDFRMKDGWGDRIEVSVSGGEVYLTCEEGDRTTQEQLTPKKARKLAKALKRAAKEAKR